jgi:peptidyl-prolyl cis-trans isomerase B (cyclophilin B)
MKKLLTAIHPLRPATALLLGWACLSLSCSRPVAQFSYTGASKAPAEIRFDNRSEKAQVFEWDFGDGNRSTDSLPVHTYKKSGTYTVTLIAKSGNKTRTMEEKIQIDAPDRCLVEIETEFGNMLVWLYDSTPQHRDNFLKLAGEGYFDSLLFHRVIKGFMVQGGDPNSRNAPKGQPLGMGGPSYTIPAEFVDTLVHVKGALAAARTGDQVNPEKRSSGSQFYIVHGQPLTGPQLDQIEARKGFRYSTEQRQLYLEKGGTPFLDRDYTVFGMVIQGLDVIDKIANAPKDQRDRPLEDVRMKIRPIQ